ncbi:hypothetical protein EON82_25765 [bacterium]|nr:MAG: hypothetical protein EON82_25765 [bacterium]
MLLIASDRRRFLRFELLPLGERHWEWHGYMLVVGDIDRGEVARLEAMSGSPLFLDREVTPEIPSMCEGLERAIDGEHFSFAPVDERDFTLSAKRSGNGVMLQTQARRSPFADETGWPLGLEVSAAALKRFTAGLRLEYEQLMDCLPLR